MVEGAGSKGLGVGFRVLVCFFGLRVQGAGFM